MSEPIDLGAATPAKFLAEIHFPTELDAVSAIDQLKLPHFEVRALSPMHRADFWGYLIGVQLNGTNVTRDRVRSYLDIIIPGYGGDYVEDAPVK